MNDVEYGRATAVTRSRATAQAASQVALTALQGGGYHGGENVNQAPYDDDRSRSHHRTHAANTNPWMVSIYSPECALLTEQAIFEMQAE